MHKRQSQTPQVQWKNHNTYLYSAAVGEPENAVKPRKALLSEEELLVRKKRNKVYKVSKKASETSEQTLHKQEQNSKHIWQALEF